MIELLVVKADKDYFRFQSDGFFPCRFSKASVYPLEQLAEVQQQCATLHQGGISLARIMKLVIEEQPYQEE